MPNYMMMFVHLRGNAPDGGIPCRIAPVRR